jgi:excisionase family DNA binding protein
MGDAWETATLRIPRLRRKPELSGRGARARSCALGTTGPARNNAWARPGADAVPTTTGDRREAASGVTIARASQLLGVTRRTVHYWIKKGKLQTTALPNGGRRILLEQRQVV